MSEENIIYTKEELRGLAIGVRTCITDMLNNGKTPYSFFLEENAYWNYVSKYKCDVIRFLPIDYLGFKHKHRDTYFHYADERKLQKIIKEGKLSLEMSHDEDSVGKAVYTYPMKSGMFFVGRQNRGKILMFEAEEEHCHITQTNDTPYCIGEADFFSDVKLLNPRIITVEEAEELSRKEFNWEIAQKEYYGIDVLEDADYDSFQDVLEHYNYDYIPMQTN